jgi:hypothetical protein
MLDNADFDSKDLLQHATSAHGGKRSCCVDLEPTPSPIDIPVPAISVAAAPTFDRPGKLRLDYLADLVRPEVFIATCHTADGLSPRTPADVPDVTLSGEDPIWPRLRSAYVSGLWIEPVEFYGTKEIVKIVYDLVHLRANDIILADFEDVDGDPICYGFADAESFKPRRAWVASSTIKELLGVQVVRRMAIWHEEFKVDQSVEVATHKALRFRTEVAKGVHKGLDFAVLEEM